jgi:hypothetical protein
MLPAFPSQIHPHDDVTYVNMKQYERILLQREDRCQAMQRRRLLARPPRRYENQVREMLVIHVFGQVSS